MFQPLRRVVWRMGFPVNEISALLECLERRPLGECFHVESGGVYRWTVLPHLVGPRPRIRPKFALSGLHSHIDCDDNKQVERLMDFSSLSLSGRWHGKRRSAVARKEKIRKKKEKMNETVKSHDRQQHHDK